MNQSQRETITIEEHKIILLEQKGDALSNDIREIKQAIIRMENRMDRMESSINNKMDSQFKWLLSMIIGSFIGLMSVIAKTQGWI